MPCRNDNSRNLELLPPTLAELDNIDLPDLDQHRHRHHHGWGRPFGFGRLRDDDWNPLYDRNSAYPVPSERQYERCVAKQGESGWTREGVWKCLFKNAEKKNSNAEQLFPDYTGFLEFRRRAREAEREQQKAARSTQKQLQTPSNKPEAMRMISEEEAKGKTVVGETISSSSFWNSNGEHETKRRVLRVFDDNTATESTTTEVRKQDSAKVNDSNGWFWK